METSTFGLEKDEFGVHQKIINWVGSNKKILEVGCASGYMSQKLVQNGCRVTGVEIDSQAANKAKKFCQKIIVGDIENKRTLKQLKKEFETIILADVLEHLREPEKTLKNLTPFLKKKGRVIISVPNIGFLTNRLLLLLGRFDYTDWGIMDKTHLRFFTRDSILKLIEKSGLKVEKLDYVANFTQLPFYMQTFFPILGKKSWWRKLEHKISGLWPGGLAVQFLLICCRK